jgi:hypothetical protein
MAHTHITQSNLEIQIEKTNNLFRATPLIFYPSYSSLFTIQYVQDLAASKTPNPLTQISQQL